MITIEDLIFEQIREHTPQYRILADGKEIATLTEGWFFKAEKYTILFTDGTDVIVETRDAACEALIKYANSLGRV